AEPDGARDPGRSDALVRLSQALTATTRGALITLRGGGNRNGADAVMTSQTGYPMAVDFSRGYPRYSPHAGNAMTRLREGDVDTVVILGSVAEVPSDLLNEIATRPTIAIGPRVSESVL